MTGPIWLTIGRKYLGVTETPGPKTTPIIGEWLRKLRAWWSDDETPWCGTFVGAVLTQAGCELPRHWYRARAWLDWGLRLTEPALGCVVVYERGGGGHVGFVTGWDQNGRILTLGGNQGNRVSIAPFDSWRVLGYRWPSEYSAIWPQPLQLAQHDGPSSSNEA